MPHACWEHGEIKTVHNQSSANTINQISNTFISDTSALTEHPRFTKKKNTKCRCKESREEERNEKSGKLQMI